MPNTSPKQVILINGLITNGIPFVARDRRNGVETAVFDIPPAGAPMSVTRYDGFSNVVDIASDYNPRDAILTSRSITGIRGLVLNLCSTPSNGQSHLFEDETLRICVSENLAGAFRVTEDGVSFPCPRDIADRYRNTGSALPDKPALMLVDRYSNKPPASAHDHIAQFEQYEREIRLICKTLGVPEAVSTPTHLVKVRSGV
jgi:hypothetical protein